MKTKTGFVNDEENTIHVENKKRRANKGIIGFFFKKRKEN